MRHHIMNEVGYTPYKSVSPQTHFILTFKFLTLIYLCDHSCFRCSMCDFKAVSSKLVATHSTEEHEGQARHLTQIDQALTKKVVEIFGKPEKSAAGSPKSFLTCSPDEPSLNVSTHSATGSSHSEAPFSRTAASPSRTAASHDGTARSAASARAPHSSASKEQSATQPESQEESDLTSPERPGAVASPTEQNVVLQCVKCRTSSKQRNFMEQHARSHLGYRLDAVDNYMYGTLNNVPMQLTFGDL